MKCPLCEKEKHRNIVTISKDTLIEKYFNYVDVDFSYLIKEDITYYECQNCKLRFFYPFVTGDETFYNSLQKFDWYYMDEKDEYHVASKYIKETDKVLEVGCGKGAFKQFLQTEDYLGLEFSKNAKKLAKKQGIKIKNKSIEEFSKKNLNKFDVVASFQVLEHVSNPKSFIEAKLNTLKKSGKLIISVPAEDSYLKYISNGLLNIPPHHITRWPTKTLKFIAQEYNLKVLDIVHEELQEVHKVNYINTLVRNSITNSKLLDDSIDPSFISTMTNLLVKGLKKEMLPKGHTISVIFEK